MKLTRRRVERRKQSVPDIGGHVEELAFVPRHAIETIADELGEDVSRNQTPVKFERCRLEMRENVIA